MIAKVKEPFCKYCKSTNISCVTQEELDGDIISELHHETWFCNDCGKEFEVSTGWKLTDFAFYDDDTKEVEEIDYVIEE